MMTKRSLFAVLLVPVCLLLIPAVANRTVDGFNWGVLDFVFAWAMMAGVGFAYKLVTGTSGSAAYRIATGIALAAGFLIVWGNLAVGFIGNDDNPANLMYGGVILIAACGAMRARCAATGMAVTMFATALVLALVPVVALIVRPGDFSPGVAHVFGLNAIFVLLFLVAGFLYRHAGSNFPRARPEVT